MKTAQKFLDDLVGEIGLPVGHTISLIEEKPRGDHGQNWIVATGNLPANLKSRYERVVGEMKTRHPNIDWSGIKVPDGERRHVSGGKAI